jgi:aminoglycoside phosphotransferase family enzyme
VIALSEKVRSLALHLGAIESIETHMSWVFLTEDHAYKLKKPVRYDYLDFSTIERRRSDCETEVRLNRRLTTGVYLGTLPVALERDGTIATGGGGEVIDWLVWMKKLPRERTLEASLGRREVSPPELASAAELLARFYRDAPARAVPDQVERTFATLSDNRRALSSLSVSRDLVDSAIVPLLRWLERRPSTLEQRRIVEGHGDLRPEHIFLLEPPAIIDCIEFNQSFRELDPVSDLGFLALECERMDAGSIGSLFLDTHRAIARDDPSPALLDFYAALHAGTRAKIALWHLLEPDHRDPRIWRKKAHRYLDLAARHADRLATE